MIFVVRWIEFCKEISQKSIKKRSRKQTPLCDRILIDFGMLLEVFWTEKRRKSNQKTECKSEAKKSEAKTAQKPPGEARVKFALLFLTKKFPNSPKWASKIDRKSTKNRKKNR